MTADTLREMSTDQEPKIRLLVFSIGDRKVAISLDYMVKILEKAELFKIPLAGREFKGIIYYNELAVPVLDWEFLTGKKLSGKNLLLLEHEQEMLALEIDERARVEEHPLMDLTGAEGFWVDMAPEKGLFALNVKKLFQSLKKNGV
jgi:chemotaxis signal transduction protein